MEGIPFIASCPLIIKKESADVQIKKVIGVLNVESRAFASGVFISDAKLKDIIHERIAKLGNIFITLHIE